jgi:hypothetical protein
MTERSEVAMKRQVGGFGAANGARAVPQGVWGGTVRTAGLRGANQEEQ